MINDNLETPPLHLFSFKTPILLGKKNKKPKNNQLKMISYSIKYEYFNKMIIIQKKIIIIH